MGLGSPIASANSRIDSAVTSNGSAAGYSLPVSAVFSGIRSRPELRAGDGDHHAGHEVGLGRGQKQVRVGDVFRTAGPPDRDEPDRDVSHRLRDPKIRPLLLRSGEPRLDEAWCHAVDVDPEWA